jgi:hypothetical protein
MAQMPTVQQERFQFIATHRGALDWEVLSEVTRMAGTGNVPFTDFANALVEYRRIQQLSDERRFLDHAKSIQEQARQQPKLADLWQPKCTAPPSCFVTSALWRCIARCGTTRSSFMAAPLLWQVHVVSSGRPCCHCANALRLHKLRIMQQGHDHARHSLWRNVP